MKCAWVFCDSAVDGRGWWCAEHAARLESDHDLDVEEAQQDA